MQLDLAIAFPLIDVRLGGEGAGQPPSREITEIEEQVIETVMRIICRELQSAGKRSPWNSNSNNGNCWHRCNNSCRQKKKCSA
jgi:flagellar motor switch protein FliM